MIQLDSKLINSGSIVYPQLVRIGQVDINTIAKEVAERAGFAESNVKGVLDALCRETVRYMALGYSVKLDGLGTFSLKLGMKAGTDREPVDGSVHRNARSVEVSGVNYRADQRLIQEANLSTDLERTTAGTKCKVSSTEEERLQLVLRHVKEHGFVRVKDYRALSGLERTMASRELRRFAELGYLVARGRHAHLLYTAAD